MVNLDTYRKIELFVSLRILKIIDFKIFILDVSNENLRN